MAVLSTFWLAYPLLAQRYTPYDPHRRQGRHDHRRTAMARWRCTETATVIKVWQDMREDLPVFTTVSDVVNTGLRVGSPALGVFSVDGRVVFSSEVQDNTLIPLNRGAYIITCEGGSEAVVIR